MKRGLNAHAAWLAPYLTVVRPPGPGPFPVVAQMHGCSGCGPVQTIYAQAACEAGIAAVIIDSFAPRGIGLAQATLTVCSGLRLRGGERAQDLTATLAWLKGQSWADRDQVAAAGWSHGGWSLMEAMVAGSPETARLKLAALFYPYAGPGARTAANGWGPAKPGVIGFLAGRDRVVGRTAPRRALTRLETDGLQVSLNEFADATHGFDDPFAHDPRIIYRPDLAASAQRDYLRALTLAFAPPASE